MVAAGLMAIAIFAQQTAVLTVPQVEPAATDDSIAARILARQPPPLDVAGLHAEAAAGPRDPAWSAASEEGLSQRYRRVPGFDDAVESFTVRCAATLCEAAGPMRPDLSTDDVTDLMGELQTLSHPDTMPKIEQIVHSFSLSVDRPQAFVFVSYWRRRY